MSLSKHTVRSYDDALSSVAADLELMLDKVKISIDMVLQSIENPDQDYYAKVQAHDREVNEIDKKIEQKVVQLLALRQPMAVDLRYVTSMLKVSANLERIGDQAKNIVGKIGKIKNRVIDKRFIDLFIDMTNISKNMIDAAVVSFNSQDAQKAEFVLESDAAINADYKEFKNIIDGENFTRSEVIDLIDILFVAKSLERLADHTTNIAELSKYVITGKYQD